MRFFLGGEGIFVWIRQERGKIVFEWTGKTKEDMMGLINEAVLGEDLMVFGNERV